MNMSKGVIIPPNVETHSLNNWTRQEIDWSLVHWGFLHLLLLRQMLKAPGLCRGGHTTERKGQSDFSSCITWPIQYSGWGCPHPQPLCTMVANANIACGGGSHAHTHIHKRAHTHRVVEDRKGNGGVERHGLPQTDTDTWGLCTMDFFFAPFDM